MRNLLKIMLGLLLGSSSLTAGAQVVSSDGTGELKPRQHDFLVGVGAASVLDTYLSPYSYKGTNLRLMRRTERQLTTHDLLFQTLLDVDGSVLDNPGGNVNEYAGGVRYAVGWLKPFAAIDVAGRQSALRFYAGPMASGYLGCVYNERNGNNPAQAKADLMIDLTAKTDYSFNLWKRKFRLDYQIVVPLIGMAFSPNYGQSYYEAFEQENYDHNLVFAYPGNMPSLRQQLLLTIPLRRESDTQLLIGYSGQFMQSKFNNLRYHSYTNAFMIGISQRFFRR